MTTEVKRVPTSISVSEIFGPTISGEGQTIGVPTVFVRTGGCDYRCSWCDTLYAVLPEHRDDWVRMTPADVFEEVARIAKGPILVTLSGGNPALQHGLEDVVTMGHAFGYTFAMETQGSTCPAWLSALDFLTVSPKPPSSGMEPNMRVLTRLITTAVYAKQAVSIKVPVFDERDYEWARGVHKAFWDVPFYLSVGNPLPGNPFVASLLESLRELMERTAADPEMRDVHVLPQLHVLAWGGRRGV